MCELWQRLVQAGLAPRIAARQSFTWGDGAACDLLPEMIQAWTAAFSGTRQTDSHDDAAALRSLLQHQRWGARLTAGLAGPAPEIAGDWLGRRLAWWTRRVPVRRSVGILSSRLGRDLGGRRAWFAALRTACMRLDPRRDILLTSTGISTQRFVRRGSQLFGLPALHVACVPEGRQAWRDWGQSVLAGDGGVLDAAAGVFLSPPLESGDGGPESPAVANTPWPDRVITALGDLLIVLHMRAGGNIQRLIQARLERPEFPPASVFLALGRGLVSRKVAEPLMDAGAVGWYVMDAASPDSRSTRPPWAGAGADAATAAPIVDCPAADDWPYLTHCTRRRWGPWPGQSETAYLDDLLLDRSGADHSALAALWRIVRHRRLAAASDLIRGDRPVVSLTAVPLPEISRLRTFRSHLARWDFEPYGICIRRDWLQQRGARPVHYGDDALWASLPDDERPLFQKDRSVTSRGAVVDWTVEREWRVVGDLALDQVPAESAFVFVAARDEAHWLAPSSPWPIAVVSGDGPTAPQTTS
jgi:hypothetical protein